MSELYAVKLTVQPSPLTQQTIEYRWAEGTWFNLTENHHTGYDTVTHYAFPNITRVEFGDKLSLSKREWQAVGSPLLLKMNEIEVIKRTLKIARGIK